MHQSYVTLLIFIHDVRQSQPQLVIHECVPGFPVCILQHYLQDLYRFVIFDSIDPVDLGYPVRRSRQYVVLYLWAEVLCFAQPAEFFRLFVQPAQSLVSRCESDAKRKMLRHHGVRCDAQAWEA